MEMSSKNPTVNSTALDYDNKTFLSNIHSDAIFYDSAKNLVTPDGLRVPLCPIQSKMPLIFEQNDPVKYFVLHHIVTAFGCYNYQGAKIPLENGFNIPFWRSSLIGSSHYGICDFLQYGFPLGTNHNHAFKQTLKNHPSAYAYHKEIDEFVTKELKCGGIAGPMNHFPFFNMQISPLMTADKDKGTARRICFDLSFTEGSVNAATPEKEFLGLPAEFNFPKVDQFEEMIVQLGAGCLMWKSDLSRFFMQLPIDPFDFNLMCFLWRDNVFFYIHLPYGHRNSGLHGQNTTSAVVHIFKNEAQKMNSGPVYALNYCDDIGGADRGVRAWRCFYLYQGLLVRLGLQESKKKAFPPSTRMPYLGILFDSIEMTKSILPERVKDLDCELDSFIRNKKCTRRNMESLMGKLFFVSSCVASSRVFTFRLMAFLRSFPDRKVRFPIPAAAKQDAEWWRRFIHEWNGVSLILDESWSNIDEIVASDASLTAGGAYTDKFYFSEEFSENLADSPIHIKEFLTLLVAVKLWGKSWAKKRIRFHCDNQNVCNSINNQKPKDDALQECLRELIYWESLYSFKIGAVYIETKKNHLADFLSRSTNSSDHIEYFKKCNIACKTRIHAPEKMFSSKNDW